MLSAIFGKFVDGALDRFAKWACENYPGNKDKAGSTTSKPKQFAAYVITDHDGSPYMTRVLFPRVFGIRPMLHHIHRADFERDLHNHPWPYAFSFILRGSYVEERLDDCAAKHDCTHETKRHVRWFNFIRGSTFHRISELHGNVWTLFCTGKRKSADASWGFREWDDVYEHYDVTPNELYLHRQRYEKLHGFESWSLEAWAADVGCEPRGHVMRKFEPVEGPVEMYEDVENDREFTDRILAWVRR